MEDELRELSEQIRSFKTFDLPDMEEAPQKRIQIHTSDNRSISLAFRSVRGKTVEELKKKVFPLETGSNLNIKLLFNGRELRNEDEIGELELEETSVFHSIIQTKDNAHEAENQVRQFGFDMLYDYKFTTLDIKILRKIFYQQITVGQKRNLLMEEHWIAQYRQNDPDFKQLKKKFNFNPFAAYIQLFLGFFFGLIFNFWNWALFLVGYIVRYRSLGFLQQGRMFQYGIYTGILVRETYLYVRQA